MEKSIYLLHGLLTQNNFIVVNKNMVKLLGGDYETTVFMVELLNKEKFFLEKGEIKPGEEIFCTFESVQNSTYLSRRAQDRAIIKLVEKGWIGYEKKGYPQKRYFTIYHDKILDDLSQEDIVYRKQLNAKKQQSDQSSKSKSDFYKKLNEATTWKEFAANGGNISMPMLSVMYLLKKRYPSYIEWNGKTYSQLKFALRNKFKGKHYIDYNVFFNAESLINPKLIKKEYFLSKYLEALKGMIILPQDQALYDFNVVLEKIGEYDMETKKEEL